MWKLDREALNRILKRIKWIYGYGKKHFLSIIIYTVIGMSGAAAVLLVGMVTAFVVSIFVIRFLMNFIKKHDFKVFGWYRIMLGIVVLAYFAIM